MKTLLHILLCYFVFVITSKTMAQENTQENIQEPAPAVHAPNIVIDGKRKELGTQHIIDGDIQFGRFCLVETDCFLLLPSYGQNLAGGCLSS